MLSTMKSKISSLPAEFLIQYSDLTQSPQKVILSPRSPESSSLEKSLDLPSLKNLGDLNNELKAGKQTGVKFNWEKFKRKESYPIYSASAPSLSKSTDRVKLTNRSLHFKSFKSLNSLNSSNSRPVDSHVSPQSNHDSNQVQPSLEGFTTSSKLNFSLNPRASSTPSSRSKDIFLEKGKEIESFESKSLELPGTEPDKVRRKNLSLFPFRKSDSAPSKTQTHQIDSSTFGPPTPSFCISNQGN